MRISIIAIVLVVLSTSAQADPKLKDICINRSAQSTSSDIVEFLKFFKALPHISHDQVAKKISDDPEYACKTFTLCTWGNYPMLPNLFVQAYDRFKEDNSIGQCPWSIENPDVLNEIINDLQTLSFELKGRKKEFEQFSQAAFKGQQAEQNLADYQRKGEKISADSKFKWELETAVDPLTRTSSSRAINVTKAGSGKVETEVKCIRDGIWAGGIAITMSFFGVKVPTNGKEKIYVKSRLNDKQQTFLFIQSKEFSNVFEIFTANWIIKNGLLYTTETTEYIYDYGVVIPTTGGDAYVEIPPYNQAIKKIIAQCKK